MQYPTMDAVREADKFTLARWHRFLPSPGSNHINKPDFEEKCRVETEIINEISKRFYDEMGGWTPELSKQVGWD